MSTVTRGNSHVPALSKSPARDESVACVGFFSKQGDRVLLFVSPCRRNVFQHSRSIFYQISRSFPLEGRSQSLVIFGVGNYYFYYDDSYWSANTAVIPHSLPSDFPQVLRSEERRDAAVFASWIVAGVLVGQKFPQFSLPFQMPAAQASWIVACKLIVLLTGSEKDEDGFYFKGNTSVPSYHKTEDIQESSESWDTGL